MQIKLRIAMHPIAIAITTTTIADHQLHPVQRYYKTIFMIIILNLKSHSHLIKEYNNNNNNNNKNRGQLILVEQFKQV